jgi:hypothetical protein
MVKAPLARDAVGRNPMDRGKKGTKRSVAVESPGLSVGIVVDRANRHDVKLLEDTLKSIVTVYSGCRSVKDKPPVSKCGYRLLFGEIGVRFCPSNAHNRQLFADFSPTEHLQHTK